MKTAWAGAVYNLMLFMLASHVSFILSTLSNYYPEQYILGRIPACSNIGFVLGFGFVLVPVIHWTTNGMLEKGLPFGALGLSI